MDGAYGIVVECLEAREDRHGGIDENEKSSYRRERAEPEGKICSQTRWVGRMQCRAGERCNERMSLR